MKREVRRLWVGLTLGTLLAGGCATKHAQEPVVVTPTGQVVVSHPPPASKHEMPGSAPATGWVWTPGYWTHYNARWVWIPGQWQEPPAAQATWVAGHWDQTNSGWIWVPGHWE